MRLLPLTLLLLALAPARDPRAALASNASGYWHTSGVRIVTSTGAPVRIVGINWYGMESATWVPAGLNFQRYQTIVDQIRLLGFNTIRLPFSNELVERNPVVNTGVAANPQLRGLRALGVLDAIVAYAGHDGLKIVLDDQRSRAARPRDVNNLDEPLWYTKQYPEPAWIRDWQTLARRYAGNPTVVGFDLRNEPHTGGPGPWNLHAYLHQGATWGPYLGASNPATDWRAAAQRAGDAILSVNPHLLILVEGVQLYPNASAPGGVDSSWWGSILSPVKRYPIQLSLAHQLVYSVHDWGPVKWQQPWFGGMESTRLLGAWQTWWGFLYTHPSAPYAAPLWIGEFGTCTDRPGCLNPKAQQGWWFASLLGLLRSRPEVGWSFFALNGTNSNDCWADNGLLNASWDKIASSTLQRDLMSIGARPLGGLVPVAGRPLLPGTATTRKPRDPHSALCLLP